MKKDYKKIASDILENVGGEKNIGHVTHCATRLRFNLVDVEKANEENIKKITGVVGVVNKGGQFQVIIGNDVSNVYNELAKLGKFNSNTTNQDKEKKNIISNILDVISGVFTPMLPTLAGAGMLKAILTILTTFNIISTDSQTYAIFNVMSDAIFYFLPIILAYTSAVKFNCNKFTSVLIAGILIHPNLIALLGSGQPVKFLGLPVTNATYSSSVIPIILIVWVMSYIERFADKISPNSIKLFFKPLVTILIITPIALVVIGPLGTIIGSGLAAVVNYLHTSFGVIVLVALGVLTPLIVMTGMHYSLFPMVITSLTTVGYDAILIPVSLGVSLAQAGAAICVAVKSKNKDMKQLAGSTGFTALLGITEPAMYGVNLKLKRPFIGVMIGGGAAALYAAIMGVKSHGMVPPGLAALPVFMDANPMSLVHAVITCIIGFVVAFIATWFLGFEDPKDENENEKENEIRIEEKKEPLIKKINIKSPISGKVIPLSEVSDETFSIMGKGIAIIPKKGSVVSPVNGKIEAIFKTKHAIGITSEEGAEILIHIGIDTVKLEGEHFTSYIKAGDTVKVGDKLVDFDIEKIKEAGYETVTPVIITNYDKYLDILPKEVNEIKEGETLINII